MSGAAAWLKAVPDWLRSLLLFVVVFYALLCLVAWAAQRRLLYFPDPQVVAPAAVGLEAEVLSRQAADGVTLTMWWVPPQGDRPVVVYFHGNGGNLAYRAAVFRDLTAAGHGLLALSYRGYGGSGGSPSEAGLILDARAAYEAARERAPAAGIVAYGESLGTGVAVRLAAERSVSGLILEAPFTAVEDRASELFWYLPVRMLLADRCRSRDHIAAVRAPLLVLHGDADTVIPVGHGRALFQLANEPKTFAHFPGAGHNDLWSRGGREEVLRFLGGLRPGAADAGGAAPPPAVAQLNRR
ncbi:alpha/beta hydrolase [Phreatobacter sp.]|uniref:alpha/beta hydrolase n=1 Tax=Phreatobacter sp. TaxID=1966341 RepID=UPI003F721CA1